MLCVARHIFADGENYIKLKKKKKNERVPKRTPKIAGTKRNGAVTYSYVRLARTFRRRPVHSRRITSGSSSAHTKNQPPRFLGCFGFYLVCRCIFFSSIALFFQWSLHRRRRRRLVFFVFYCKSRLRSLVKTRLLFSCRCFFFYYRVVFSMAASSSSSSSTFFFFFFFCRSRYVV